MKTSEIVKLAAIAIVLIIGVVLSILAYKMNVPDSLTLICVAIGVFFGIYNSFVSNALEKRLKAYEIWIEEVHELNVKMHDRLVDVEETITSDKLPGENERKRLLYNASRLQKYDESIVDDVMALIEMWTKWFSNKGSMNSDEQSEEKLRIISAIKAIKKKVDNLQSKLSD